MTNNEAAEMFLELADLVDLAGELPFKATSYRKVAKSLRDLKEPFSEIAKTKKWTQIPGAGKAIREKLSELVNTGKIPALDKWRKQEIALFYPNIAALGLKPRPLGLLIRKLKARDFEELLEKLHGCDIKDFTGQSRETAKIIIEANS
jgi:DNA polymerase (family 10)